jgi:RNA-directed DNA polymerase
LKVKSFDIPKRLVFEAWEKVQANKGAPGVDAVSIAEFAADEGNNLYKVWNRMSSGSYFPGPVRAVEIPKDHGAGVRTLGVPNTVDRVAQTAAAMLLEEKLEPIFHTDSYGYRPGRSAHDALVVTRKRCWEQDWVLDLDVRAFFDSVPHDLLLKAVAHHTDERWVLLYIERWLRAPMQMPDGTLVAREKGTIERRERMQLRGPCHAPARGSHGGRDSPDPGNPRPDPVDIARLGSARWALRTTSSSRA